MTRLDRAGLALATTSLLVTASWHLAAASTAPAGTSGAVESEKSLECGGLGESRALAVDSDAPAPPRVTLWSRMSSGFRGLGTTDSAVLLGAGAVAAALAVSFEEDPVASSAAIEASVFEGGVDVGDLYGHGMTVGLGAGALLLAGRLGHEPLGAAGRDLLASFAVASAGAWALKVSVGRRRPLGGPHSFPSGHTAVAFSTLPAIHRHAGPWAGLVATVLALGTGAARVEDQRHYMSDVLFGAALGYASGLAVMGESIPWSGIWNKMTLSRKGVGFRVRF